jgi:transcriptional regulator with XRE-family HTH domain
MDAVVDERKLAENLAENLKRLLVERDWSQAELARRSQQRNMEISRICNALYLPNLSAVVRIAEALQVSVDYLLADHPEFSQQAS